MSTLAIEALLEFKQAGKLHLCQEFIWYNPAKLPTPAQWVSVDRVRVKDAFTRLWWMSPNPKPKADNTQVLAPYSSSMRELLQRKRYNAGRRPSEHSIGQTSFFADNGGAIPPNVLAEDLLAESVLAGSNTSSRDEYLRYCELKGLEVHPARMPQSLPNFFIRLCTDPGDLVFDPFAGSNTTGAAAEQLGRNWVSVEANAQYAHSGLGRFAVATESDDALRKTN
jgi:site-specific DNA-methyltransferase (cytosine-N4-specific)